MKKLLPVLVFCFLALWARAQLVASGTGGPAPIVARPADTAGPLRLLAGAWTGPLDIPGKTLPIRLTIGETGGRLVATLGGSAAHLSHHTLTLTQRHDTLCFYDPLTEARYECQRSPDGTQLVGLWQQPGFRKVLVLRYEAPKAAVRTTRTTKWASGEVENDHPVGVWHYYTAAANGQRVLTQTYDHRTGQLLFGSSDGNAYEAELSPGHWGRAVLTQSPWFVGGQEALAPFSAAVRYPVAAMKANIEGRVVVSFVVDTLGHVSGHRVVRGLGSGCDEEALRVARTIPDTWKPGRLGTRAVAAVYLFVFTFRLP